MTLLDTCMAIAAYSTLVPAIRYSTIETKVNFTRPITAATGMIESHRDRGAYGKEDRHRGRPISRSARVLFTRTARPPLFYSLKSRKNSS